MSRLIQNVLMLTLFNAALHFSTNAIRKMTPQLTKLQITAQNKNINRLTISIIYNQQTNFMKTVTNSKFSISENTVIRART